MNKITMNMIIDGVEYSIADELHRQFTEEDFSNFYKVYVGTLKELDLNRVIDEI